jgi:hypothetical protein
MYFVREMHVATPHKPRDARRVDDVIYPSFQPSLRDIFSGGRFRCNLKSINGNPHECPWRYELVTGCM